MKKSKTSYKMYPAWEFDREVADLEAQSEKGWQLQKGGCFHSKFVFDNTVRYRYALDFNQDIADPARYRETFAEQGWEFVNSTFNGWHFFRKAYDPSLPEEEYEIYTDADSRREMAGRWKRLAYILGGMELAVGLLNLLMNLRHPAIYSICLGLGCLLLGLLLVVSAKWIGQSDRRRASTGWLLLPVLALFLIALAFGVPRADFDTYTEYAIPEDGAAWEFSFDVKIPDFYTLELDVDAPADVTVSVVDESKAGDVLAHVDGEWMPDGGVIRTVIGQRIDQRVTMFLTPGTYTVSTQYDPDATPGLAGQFTYELD